MKLGEQRIVSALFLFGRVSKLASTKTSVIASPSGLAMTDIDLGLGIPLFGPSLEDG
jgi:hypothetical protein